jgi:hypothetical protein
MLIEMGIEAFDFLARFVGPSTWIGIRGVKGVSICGSGVQQHFFQMSSTIIKIVSDNRIMAAGEVKVQCAAVLARLSSFSSKW